MIDAVEVPAAAGVVLRGELRLGGPDWAVLVHDQGEDIDAWRPLAAALAGRGLSVLALDLRGHGGSDGEVDPSTAGDDIRAALAFAREHHAGRLYLVAAGRSSVPAVEVGAAERCDALLLLAPVGEGLDRAALPRLTVVSSLDAGQQAAARGLHRGRGWSLVANVPVQARGCGLLAGRWGTNVVDYATAFLSERRFAPAGPVDR